MQIHHQAIPFKTRNTWHVQNLENKVHSRSLPNWPTSVILEQTSLHLPFGSIPAKGIIRLVLIKHLHSLANCTYKSQPEHDHLIENVWFLPFYYIQSCYHTSIQF